MKVSKDVPTTFEHFRFERIVERCFKVFAIVMKSKEIIHNKSEMK